MLTIPLHLIGKKESVHCLSTDMIGIRDRDQAGYVAGWTILYTLKIPLSSLEKFNSMQPFSLQCVYFQSIHCNAFEKCPLWIFFCKISFFNCSGNILACCSEENILRSPKYAADEASPKSFLDSIVSEWQLNYFKVVPI